MTTPATSTIHLSAWQRHMINGHGYTTDTASMFTDAWIVGDHRQSHEDETARYLDHVHRSLEDPSCFSLAPSNVEPLDLVAIAEWLKGLAQTLEDRHQVANEARLAGGSSDRPELDKAEAVASNLVRAVTEAATRIEWASKP